MANSDIERLDSFSENEQEVDIATAVRERWKDQIHEGTPNGLNARLEKGCFLA